MIQGRWIEVEDSVLSWIVGECFWIERNWIKKNDSDIKKRLLLLSQCLFENRRAADFQTDTQNLGSKEGAPRSENQEKFQ